MSLNHKKISAWYLQLAQQLEAGLPLIAAIRSNAGAPAAGREALASRLEQGEPFSNAIGATGSWLPRDDRPFLATASSSGRLPRTLRNLSARHSQLAAASSRVVLACVYPVGVLHVALLMFPVLRMLDWEGGGFRWDGAAWLGSVACTLLPLWALAITARVLAKRESPLFDRVLRLLPVLRRYRREQSLADFSFALGNLLEAGAPIGEAWATAGRASRSPVLDAAARSIRETIRQGRRPGERLEAFSCFPDDFVTLYRTGEATGQLDADLLRLSGLHQENANASLRMATLFYPGLIFAAVVVVVGYHIIRFVSGYVNELNKLMG
jgi:general secretion pathway protein F/type IV pilus assembly protein PilC